MKIAFLYWGYENPGIEALSASLKAAGHETVLIFDPALFNTFHMMSNALARYFDATEKIKTKIIQEKPDLIAIPALSEDYAWALKQAEIIKEITSVPVLLGGKHPTSVPDKVIREKNVDYIITGEADEAIVDLCNALEKGEDATNIKNICGKDKNGQIFQNELRNLNQNLDELPFPDKDIFYDEYSGFANIYTISTSRGCPHTCSYCHNNMQRSIYKGKGPYLRRRSVDNVIEELTLAKSKYSIKRIYFLDEIFIYDLKWLAEFAVKYKEKINIPFGCETYSTFVNEEAINLLIQAGCKAVDMGIQTISEDIRKDILQRPGSNESIANAIALFRKTKIFLYTCIILGIPGTDTKEVIDTALFLNKHKPDMVLTNWLRFYPKTDIVDIAYKHDMLRSTDIRNIENYGGGFSPFVRKGHTFSKDLGKAAHLVIMAPFVPSFILKFFIKTKIYKLFPSTTFLHLNINSLLGTWYKKLIERRHKILYFTVSGQLKYMWFYIKKHFKDKKKT